MYPNGNPYPSNPANPGSAGDDAALPMETLTEPLEGAFTIRMPAGWRNQANLQREHGLNRVIASSASPDGGTMLYFGDPRLPGFMEPTPYISAEVVSFNPSLRIQPYTPAPAFFQDYLWQCFGQAPGFRLTDLRDSPEFQRACDEGARQGGHRTQSTSARIAFEHSYQGRPMRCVLHGVTATNGSVWITDLYTVKTTGDPARYEGTALQIACSRTFNPAWAAAQQRLHEQRMAMGQQQLNHMNDWSRVMTEGHNQRMHDIQNVGQANTQMHQDRMAQSDARHQAWMQQQQAGDAQQQAWMSQQNSEDAQQQARVNAIREEHTVQDAAGNAYQVDSHHERYFVNKRDNTYIATNGATGLSDLRHTHGVNPDDYEEVRIVR